MGPDSQQNVIHGTGSATECNSWDRIRNSAYACVLDQIYLSLELDPQQFVVRVTGSATVVNSEVPVPQSTTVRIVRGTALKLVCRP